MQFFHKRNKNKQNISLINENKMEELPPQKFYNLTHYTQRYNWDCGISCILMILTSAQRQEFLNNFSLICSEEGFGSSTWTIDLCYLLRRFNVKHEYYTKTLGIDPAYMLHNYYSGAIEKDEERVKLRFKNAEGAGIHVEQRTVEIGEVMQHLARHGPVILLTNASLLTCEICHQTVGEKFACLPYCLLQHAHTPDSYAGHYVVLCGFDLKLKKIYYHNPEVDDGHICHCSTNALDIARKAYGTDEDVILIFQK